MSGPASERHAAGGKVRKWLDRLNDANHVYALLFTASFLETIIIPIPIELVLIPFMLANTDRLWRIAAVVTAGCLAAAVVGCSKRMDSGRSSPSASYRSRSRSRCSPPA